MQNSHYEALIEINKEYIETFRAIYRLATLNEAKIDEIFKIIKNNLIETKIFSPNRICSTIYKVVKYNNRFLKSYLYLFYKINIEFHLKDISVPMLFQYLIYNEYGIILDKKFKPKSKVIEAVKNSLKIHQENTIYRAILNDDKEQFISFLEREGFDENRKLGSFLYPNSLDFYKFLDNKSNKYEFTSDLSLIEICCYHGSVDCFKLLRTKFDMKITKRCLKFSFLGGNPEIMNECLKYKKPNNKCMKYAIISHNIDFVAFLYNEHMLDIDETYCWWFNNLQSFLIYFDQNNNLDKCFLISPLFFSTKLCEYLLSQGANINAHGFSYLTGTALHTAACHDLIEIAEFLISNGADINARNFEGNTPLHIAASFERREMEKFLISHGANVNLVNYDGLTYDKLHTKKNDWSSNCRI